ncbi:hypothetical protein GCM10011400_64770 [Paraburkholderia caffeinilytica]|uniref:Uncharacterized protein n=1 Tax=Paraburkholderia caffeinilytica TaxID=1761016 RepID=A0ABQ1NBH1_9BURK|nr:hypothetical protein GCM10011400_64770 [Paraburkholderia caffeinilytica]
MCLHKALGRVRRFRFAAIQLRVYEIKRSDIECGRNGDPRSGCDKALDEIETHGSVIQTPVDMSGGNVDKSLSVHHMRRGDDYTHRERCTITQFATQHCSITNR